jgi:glyoxylase-like metal-dependent hydrolase (beta-lactamase superfamily II)
MNIECFTVGMFQVNTYLVTDEASGASAIIDTGESHELAQTLRARADSLNVVAILLTHGHIDHAGSLPSLQALWDVPTYLGARERPLFEALPRQGDWFGMPQLNRPCGRIDHWIDDGAEIPLGDTTLRYLSTPGHTPGQGCFYDDADIIVGDTLFAGSIGRTDFPMSNPADMRTSLERLFELPHHLRVHSGHGPVTTLAAELKTNPFVSFLREREGVTRS